MDDFELYSAAGLNSVEAAIWFFVGILLLVGSKKLSLNYSRRDVVVLGILFVAFGISDVVEVFSGAWWQPWWLLIWKTLNAIGLVVYVGKLYLVEKKNKRGNKSPG